MLAALNHGEAGSGEGVDFGCVVEGPLLALLPHAVVEYQYSIAVQAVDNGLGNRGAGLDAVHPRDALQRLS
jgi:hypothetical protein